MSCYNSIVVNSSSKFKEHAIEWQRPSKRRRHDNNLTLSESIVLLIVTDSVTTLFPSYHNRLQLVLTYIQST